MRTFVVHSETTIHEIEGEELTFRDNFLQVYNDLKQLVLIVNLEKIITIEIHNN